MLKIDDEISLSARKLKALVHDAEKAARAVNLLYVQDQQPGITRIKKNKNFHYMMGKKPVVDEATLERIRKLVIPPAWQEVWICQHENGHLQATGLDARNRKQYKYHNLWNQLRNHTKFYRLHEFGTAIPAMRQQLQKHLALPGLPVEKVLAAVVCLMEATSIRIGNAQYEKLYGSFGITTLKDKHVKISGDKLQLNFVGKKGISHNIQLNSKRLAKIVKQCRDIPGQELFQYYDEQGNHKPIDSGMVNAYIKTISGQDFTAKDFRTWAGTVEAIVAFKALGQAETQADIKKNVLAMLDQVSGHLGNTRSVCRKYYVHPRVIELYESNKLHRYFQKRTTSDGQLTSEEVLLLNILAKGL